MLLKTSKRSAATILSGFVFLLLLAALSASAMAATNSVSRGAKSISFVQSAQPDKLEKDARLKQVSVEVLAPLSKQGFRQESTATALKIVSISSTSSVGINIYDAFTELVSDFNGNGFYHRFSVTVDVDTIYDTAYVYARLYLSFEGGPWNYYASSNNYHVYGDSDLDAFVIETELADGFPPGYYDVRIELYDADSDRWLFSYGPYDDASLSALPLEDSYYDEQYPVAIYPVESQIVVASHGGAASVWLLLLPLIISMLRKRGKTYDVGASGCGAAG